LASSAVSNSKSFSKPGAIIKSLFNFVFIFGNCIESFFIPNLSYWLIKIKYLFDPACRADT
jgi:hypothetical protein